MADENEIDVQVIGQALEVLRSSSRVKELRAFENAAAVLTAAMPEIGKLTTLTARVVAATTAADQAEADSASRITVVRTATAEEEAAHRQTVARFQAERASMTEEIDGLKAERQREQDALASVQAEHAGFLERVGAKR